RDGEGRRARVLAFTDDLLRDALVPGVLARGMAAMPAGAIVHLVSTSAGGAGDYGFERDDEHPFAPVVARTVGMVVSFSGSAAGAVSAADAMRGLVQLLGIDGVAVDAGGVDLGFADTYGDQLAAGAGVLT